jgi:hypothetical protein
MKEDLQNSFRAVRAHTRRPCNFAAISIYASFCGPCVGTSWFIIQVLWLFERRADLMSYKSAAPLCQKEKKMPRTVQAEERESDTGRRQQAREGG